MSVRCAKCGEELLGSVNRCWRCGQAFEGTRGAGNLPPVRQAPIADLMSREENLRQKPLSAEVQDEPPDATPATDAVADSAASAGSPQVARDSASVSTISAATPASTRPTGTRTIREGSPFAPGSVYVPPVRVKTYSTANTVVAVLALLGGIVALLMSFRTAWALPICVVALGLGLWGIHSDQRKTALAGMILSCIALALAGFRATVALYIYFWGYNPLELL